MTSDVPRARELLATMGPDEDVRRAGIALEGLSKQFGQGRDAVLAVDDVDLSSVGGSFTALIGPSGCGKSTVLRILAGVETATSGNVRINDVAPDEARVDATSSASPSKMPPCCHGGRSSRTSSCPWR